MVFHVLKLKVDVMYFELLLVVTLKESKCMCMSYTSSSSHDHHGLKHMNIDEFINLCTSVDMWCIPCFYKT